MSRRLIALGCILLAFVAITAQAPRFAAAFRYQLPTWANWKAYSPYPVNYLARLRMLDGWDATAGDGLNCSGFISNAHGVHFRKSYDYYTNRLDTFFAGHVRLYRWKAAAQFAPLAVMSTLGKDNSSHE